MSDISGLGQIPILGEFSSLQIAVVDDDPAVCDALATILEGEGWEVTSFLSGQAFLATAHRHHLDCVLLDVHMPAESGLEVLKSLGGSRFPAPVILISDQGDIPMAVAAIKAGAHDFVEKPFEGEAVIARIRAAVRLRTEAQSHPAGRRFPGAQSLTARELDVLDQLVRGLSNKEAGRVLGISPRTVEVHRARVMEKLNARNTADLMRIVLSER